MIVACHWAWAGVGSGFDHDTLPMTMNAPSVGTWSTTARVAVPCASISPRSQLTLSPAAVQPAGMLATGSSGGTTNCSRARARGR